MTNPVSPSERLRAALLSIPMERRDTDDTQWGAGFTDGWNRLREKVRVLAESVPVEPPIIEVEGREGVVHRVWDTSPAASVEAVGLDAMSLAQVLAEHRLPDGSYTYLVQDAKGYHVANPREFAEVILAALGTDK